MKKMISLLLCALMLTGMGVSVFAEMIPQVIAEGDCSYTTSDSVSWKVTDDGILTIYGTGKMKNYSYEQNRIPPYDEYKDTFHTLVIESGVTSIGADAFRQFDHLIGSLHIPDSVTSIGASAFYRCTGFTGDLAIPERVTSIGIGAFSGCTGFNGTLNLGKSLRTISHQCFLNCKNLKGQIIIPDTVTKIDSECFANDSGFTGDLILPENVTQVGTSAFSWCTGLNGNLFLNENLQRIDMYAFRHCSGLKGDIVIPDSVTFLGTSAFAEDSSFDGGISIGSGVKTINASAFYGCTGLTVPLSIPETVTNVGSCAFHGCGLNNNLQGFFTNHPEYLRIYTTGSKAPTCTKDGVRVEDIHCNSCDMPLKYISEALPARGHSLVKVDLLDPTQDQPGHIGHYRCTVCGALFYDADGTQPATEEGITIPCLPQTVKAEEIILNTDHIELLSGDTFQLTATVLPEDAADKTVNWYTESNGIVTVDWNTGLVTAMLPGSTFVTCFSADGPLVTVPVTVHNPGAPTYENISVRPTCTDPGAGDLVIYCVDCGKELSREQGAIPATGVHTEDGGNQENIVFPDCTHGGSYDYVIHCTICGEILSSVHHSAEPLGHNPGAAQKTDVVAETCTEKGSYTETIRCETCGEIISTETHEIAATGHKPGDPEIGNTVTPTCTKKGSHSETVLCAVCGTVLSEKTVNDGYAEHNWDEGTVQSDEHDRYTVTDYTCTDCGIHKTVRHANPNYQFRCERCDWYDANKDAGGVFGIVVWMVHTITHLVQQINYWT